MRGEPRAEVAARWMVSTVSVEEQIPPRIRPAEIHSTTITGVPSNTVPVRSTPAGLRIV